MKLIDSPLRDRLAARLAPFTYQGRVNIAGLSVDLIGLLEPIVLDLIVEDVTTVLEAEAYFQGLEPDELVARRVFARMLRNKAAHLRRVAATPTAQEN